MSKISVIIPAYNRAHLIKRAVDSVLAQTYRDYEIIVIDDGSGDNTREVLSIYGEKIKYFYQENQGVSLARNLGIQKAQGEYIAFLDSDDAWAPEKLTLQAAVLDNNPKVGLVYNKLIIFDPNGKRVGTKPSRPSGRNFWELVAEIGDLPTSSILVRKKCFDKAGLFDDQIPIIEDYDMWLRIAHDYEIQEIQEGELAYYYQHQHQVTNNPINVYRGLILLDIKIMRNFSHIPRSVIIKRLAKNQYTLSRIYFNEKDYVNAFNYLSQSLIINPFVGISFMENKDSLFIKLFKIIKPYLYFFVCLFNRIFQR